MNPKALVTIYSKPGCHLCEEAEAEINLAGVAEQFTLEIINIENDPALARRYGLEIPVIVINGITAFKYRLTAAEFKKALQNYSTGNM